jgi:uncharacterized membrane protein YcaP (DUF421 family)
LRRRERVGEEVMFEAGAPIWEIAIRTVLIYIGVFVGLRVMGKREIGQMTVFDLVVVLLIANAVQNAMVGPDTSVQGGLVAAGVLLGANRGLAALRLHGGVWGRLVEGNPTVLVQDGQYLDAALRKEGLECSQVEMAMREHGIDEVQSVRLAVLETDGSISIVPKTARMIRTRKHVRQIPHR